MASLPQIYSWFQTGDIPTQEQFQQTFSSFRHKEDKIAIQEINGLETALNNKLSTQHINDENAHNTVLSQKDASNLTDDDVAKWKEKLDFPELNVDGFVTTNTIQDIEFSKNFMGGFSSQGFRYQAFEPTRQLTITPASINYDERLSYLTAIGRNVLSSLVFKEENEPGDWSVRYTALGNDIFKDFTGNTNYRPGHPAHDSLVGFGIGLGGGVLDGTNFSLFGTGIFTANDVPYWDYVTGVGKGISNAKGKFNSPNRVALANNGFNLRDMMANVVAHGNEIWAGDFHSAVLLGSHIRLYKYIFNSVVIGSNNQDYSGVKYPGETHDIFLDNDVIVGNGIYKDPKKHKPTHNFIVGSTEGYGIGGWDQSYIPLIEGYMKYNDKPYLGINGKLELRNTDANELVEHSDNLIIPTDLGGWQEEKPNTIFKAVGGLNGVLQTGIIAESGKNYVIVCRPIGTWEQGVWEISVGGFTENGSTEQFALNGALVSPTTNTNLTLTATNAIGTIELLFYEVDLSTMSDSIFTIIDSNKKTTFESRFGRKDLNSFYFGLNSGAKTITSTRNIGIGNNTLSNINTAFDCTVIGQDAVVLGKDIWRTLAIGTRALHKVNAPHNTAVGVYSQENNESGVFNSSFGLYTLRALVSGIQNTAIGTATLLQVTTGRFNIGLGSFAGLELTTGSYGIYIGKRSTASSLDAVNEIVIGSGVPDVLPESGDPTYPNIGKGSNTVKLGNEKIQETYLYGDLKHNDADMFWFGTQAEYDVLPSINPNTMYFIEDPT